jgi:hypothetical protein
MIFSKKNDGEVTVNKKATGVKRNAPCWVKDCFNELLSSGLSNQDAIMQLKRSPFFHSDFIQFK